MSIDNHKYLDGGSLHQESVFRSIPNTVANRVRNDFTDDCESVRVKSKYLLRAGYHANSIDKALDSIRFYLKNQIKVATASFKQKCITSFTPIYYPVLSDGHTIFR